MHRKALPLLTASSAALLLAACAVGPKAPDPTVPAQGQGAFVGSQSASVSTEAARADWWRLYNDATLDGLIQQALTENNELEAAAANLRAVRASLSEARAGRLPTTNANAGFTRSRASTITNPAANGAKLDDVDTYTAGLDVSYEVDLFGRVESSVRAARGDADAAREALEVVRITVAAETARAYADTCSANAQIAVAERTIDLQGKTVDLTQRLLDGGSGNGLDVARARAALEQTRASLPPLRASRDGALYRLSTLTGRTPAEASEAARGCQSPPQLSQPIPIGDGAALLARRPDVRQAEARLAAAAARVNVATASLYPSISLGGSLGSTALDSSDLGEDANFRFSVGPLISWNFPNIAVARARIKQADAQTDAALATFDQTVLTALQETETALSSYANELDRRTALRTARDQAATAARLSRLRFDAGADSFLTVLDSERTLAGADAALAASEAQVTTYQIALFKALAGGWDQAPDPEA
ncbi:MULTISPECIES: efflux transporter outer membrane subunit [unclassified Brevundimonas]|uniref:efflux transporter outer membrane subunit n=1 Tax=unclassified Brevundimonas TaxID=2622653 RepID=UPI000CFDD83D|nr:MULTISPECIES: TolC family protein [unclassified Brevundimonas]PRA36694.1 RND transporter [Brevundimonas sp. MYb27]PQZ79446.1 RND transporter [Brevundimonas sp. MYb31]PRB13035.1 RND transporter [Brevundimonas sp. MYb52]PRB33609.1 RND transporter [Brevundimonas sp. MYb46]PRB48944.1 RND transporter [Brevundimonas sp. MYb33]